MKHMLLTLFAFLLSGFRITRQEAQLIRIRADGATLDQMQTRMTEIKAQAQAIRDKYEDPDAITDDDIEALEALHSEFEDLTGKVQAATRASRAMALSFDDNVSAGRRAGGNPSDAAGDADPTDPGRQIKAMHDSKRPKSPATVRDNLPAGNAGFKSLGEFAQSVVLASTPGVQIDSRLERIKARGSDAIRPQAAVTDSVVTSIGEQGGFLIPDTWRDGIQEKVEALDDRLMPSTDVLEIAGNAFHTVNDETTPWGSSGIQAYWDDELDQLTASKPKFEKTSVQLGRITALVQASEEMLEDANSLEAHINKKAPDAINWKVDDAIYDGNGVGKPLGLLQSPALITVAKEGSQAADTILYENIIKMYARSSRVGSSVWLMNQDTLPQLLQMVISGGNSDTPIYIPPGGASVSPYGTLMGRPIVFSDHCKTLGDLGDVMFVDLSQYLTLRKTTGIQQAMSMHLYFDYAATAFRFILRVGGRAWQTSVLTPPNSSATRSPYITLAARA